MDRSSGLEEQEEELFKVQRNTNSGRRTSSVEKLWTDLSTVDGVTAEASMLEALQRIKESETNNDSDSSLVEVEKILKNIISMSREYSQSEAMLTFYQESSLDSVQPFFQSPVTVADIWRSNGFCLANTETILYDAFLLKDSEKLLPVHSARCSSQMLTERRQEEEVKYNEGSETLNSAKTGIQEAECIANSLQRCITNMSFVQLEACETDILE